MTRFLVLAVLAAAGLLAAGVAGAVEPEPWQMGLQPAASPVMEEIHTFNDLLLWIIGAITVFVMVLLMVVIFRFNEKANPTPSKTTHNTLLEIVWTVVPIIILVVIAIPSFQLLYLVEKDADREMDMTIKAIGRQWYWSYEFPDHGNFTYDAYMIADEDLEEGQVRLLETDNALVLPVETNIRILVTASDVLHNFAMPSMGLKMDAVPGRVNETWVRITKEGKFYGQCSELCGTGHAYMPIMIEAVSKEKFAEWVEQAKEEFARVEDPDRPLSLAEAGKETSAD